MRPVADPKASRKAGEDAADDVGAGFDGDKRGKGLGGSFAGGLVSGIGMGLSQQLPGMIGGFAKELFGLAGSMEEIDRRAGVVFGDNLPRAVEALDAMNESLGLSESQALGAAAGIGDILVPLGFARDAATDMALELVELGGALAGNTGGTRTAEEAHAALTAALTGEREQLKQYGVVLNEETVKLRVAEMATRGLVYETEAQAKAAATLELVTEASGDAIELWNTRAGTQAEATALTKAKMQEAKEELAEGLAPAMLAGTELAAGFAGALATGVSFLMEHKDAVLLLGTAYAGLKAGNALGGAITSMQNARVAHGSMTAAMKSSLGKVFTPQGLAFAALAVGVALLVKRWKDAAAARAEFNKDAKTVATALTNENGLVVDLSGSWDDLSDSQLTAAEALAVYLETDSRFKDKNQLDDLARMGLSYEDLGAAIHGTEESFRDFLARADSSGEITGLTAENTDLLVSAWREGPEALTEMTRGLGFIGDELGGNTDLLVSFAREQDVTIEGLRDQALGSITAAQAAGAYGQAHADALRETVAAAESISVLTDIQNTNTAAATHAEGEAGRLVARYGTLADGVDDTTDALGDDTDALGEEEEAAEDTRSEVEKLADTYGELTDMVDEARAAIDRMKGGQVSLDDATLGLNEEMDNLSATLEENTGGFDIGTEAGRENMEQARDTAESIRDLELAMVENGTAVDEAKAFTDLYRDALSEQLVQAGLTETGVGELIDTYGEVPDDVGTALSVDTGQPTQEILDWIATLNGIPASKSTTITTTYAAVGGPGGGNRAHGGRNQLGQPTLVGERGPELVVFDQPSRTLTAAQTAAGAGQGSGGIGELHVNITGTMDLTDPNTARRVAERIRDELVHLEAETR